MVFPANQDVATEYLTTVHPVQTRTNASLRAARKTSTSAAVL